MRELNSVVGSQMDIIEYWHFFFNLEVVKADRQTLIPNQIFYTVCYMYTNVTVPVNTVQVWLEIELFLRKLTKILSMDVNFMSTVHVLIVYLCTLTCWCS